MSPFDAPLSGERVRLEPGSGAGFFDIMRLADMAIIGRAELAFEGDRVTFRSVCIDPAHRGYGAGSEAVRLLQGAAASAGISTIRAWAHPQLGLSAYFWARMGLHPLHGEGPDGGIWYERQLSPTP